MIIRERTKDVILQPKTANKILVGILNKMEEFERDKEHFWVFGLNTRMQVVYLDQVSIGTVNMNLVHPREVFRTAVLRGVTSIIVAHNHPSGNTEPSQEDIGLTSRLLQAGKLMGIDVLDHIIVGEGFRSLKQAGLMDGFSPLENLERAISTLSKG